MMAGARWWGVVLLCLAGCTSGSGPSVGGTANVGEYAVTWRPMVDIQPGINDHLTDLVFSFAWVNPLDSNGVTQAHWQREAARLNTTVDLLKRAMPGNVFLTKEGTIGICHGFAIEKGLCDPAKRKPPVALNVPQRARLAKAAFVPSSRCQWIGFDPALHQAFETRVRPTSPLLYVQVDCP